MQKITYIGPAFDSSGYGNASRNNIAALTQVGVDLEVIPISFEAVKSNLGELGNAINKLVVKKPTLNNIRILHCTPENYIRVLDKSAYNIGYAAWETSKLPAGWPPLLNQLNELWVPSQYNVEVFKNSGVTCSIRCVPHTFDMNDNTKPETGLIERRNPDEFLFYSIFQWLERKNPSTLLRAYFTEFNKHDNVTLVLKSFLFDHQRAEEKEVIKGVIKDVKKRLFLDNYHRTVLVTDLLSYIQILGLHDYCDAFVLPHRCEGFGIPIAEAMLSGNPTISTGYGGAVDFVDHEKTGYLTDYQLTPVFGMPWKIYSGDQDWAEPDISHLKKLMRRVYENREESKSVGKAAGEYIRDNLSWEAVGSIMKKRLLEINETL